MGTTAQKLQAVLDSKNDIKAALTERGQSPADVFSEYGSIIRNMETSVDGEEITAELAEQTATADELVAIAKRKYFETLNTGIYVWKKLTAEGGDFIEYVVSGDETTYPDGGEQDGYWYELVEEGVSGIAYGRITLTSSGNDVSVTHGLGVTPNRIYVVGDPSLAATATYAQEYFAIVYSANGIHMNENRNIVKAYDTDGIQYASINAISNLPLFTEITEQTFTIDELNPGSFCWVVTA